MIVVALGAPVACTKQETPAPQSASPGQSQPTTQAQSNIPVPADAFMIPAAFDMTGPTSAAFIGSIKPAWEDYWNYVNENGGILGRKVGWRIYDSKQSPAEGPQVWKRMVTDFPKAPLIELDGTGVRVAVKQMAAEDKRILTGVGHNLDTANPPGWIFTPNNLFEDMIATALEQYFLPQWKESRPLRFAFILQDAAWAKAVEDVIPYLKKIPNLEVLPSEYMAGNAMDLTAQMNRLKDAGVDVVWIQHVEPGTAVILREAQRMGIKDKVKWITSPSVDPVTLFPLTGDLINGLYQLSTTNSPFSDDKPGVKLVVDLFKKNHPDAQFRPGIMYAHEMLVLMVAKEAIDQTVQRVGSWDKLTGEALYETYQSLKVDTGGLSGPIAFGKNKRWGVDYNIIWQFNAKGEPRAVSDWLKTSRVFPDLQ